MIKIIACGTVLTPLCYLFMQHRDCDGVECCNSLYCNRDEPDPDLSGIEPLTIEARLGHAHLQLGYR